jgi:hypothetical protein
VVKFESNIFLRGVSCPFEITGSIAAPLNRMRRPTGLIKPGGRILSARSAAFRPSFACLSADKNGTPTMIAIPNVSLDDPSIADNFAVRRRVHTDAANNLGSRVCIVGGGRQSCPADYLDPAEASSIRLPARLTRFDRDPYLPSSMGDGVISR